MKRQETIEHFKKNPEVSVLIVGAGINGIGTFRDLSLQGMDVMLVDRGDFCSGASAASSHMVHGGIRYLENGEFRLVREAVRERNRLIQNAPHYVHPLPTTIPIFKWLSGLANAPLKFLGLLNKPAERGAVVIKVGLMMYDTFTRGQGTVPRHTFQLRKKSLESFPKLNPEVICAATYFDGNMPSPERICMDLISDGEAASSTAQALNYCALVDAQNGAVLLQDMLNGEKFPVQPKIVVNAAGPWIDQANRAMNKETMFIGGTKGSHLVLDHSELCQAIGGHEFFFENKDGRIVLLFPLEGKVLVGTSDIRVEDPDHVRCTEEEVDYFLEMVHVVFPSIQVDRSHIVYRFSGVRPLPYSDASFTGQISRDHSIRVLDAEGIHEYPILSLVGGKWTSFRAFSEETADWVLDYLGWERRINTGDLPIGGGRDYPKTLEERQSWIANQVEGSGLEIEQVERLFKRYGTRAIEIARYIAQERDSPLRNNPEFSKREIRYLVKYEKIAHLDDLVQRRTMMAKLGDLSFGLLVELAEIAGEALAWSEKNKDEEVQRTLGILSQMHGVQLS